MAEITFPRDIIFKGRDPQKTEEEQSVVVKQKGNVERVAQQRYGNTSKVRLEIRYGQDRNTFELDKVHIDYLKAPQHLCLTQKQYDLVEDTSQILEWPDYVCQEILNELTHIVMENIQDPRIMNHSVMSQTIPGQPAQPQQAQQQG